jgi:hypothetical protein
MSNSPLPSWSIDPYNKAQEEVKMLHVEKKSKKGKKAPVGAEA